MTQLGWFLQKTGYYLTNLSNIIEILNIFGHWYFHKFFVSEPKTFTESLYILTQHVPKFSGLECTKNIIFTSHRCTSLPIDMQYITSWSGYYSTSEHSLLLIFLKHHPIALFVKPRKYLSMIFNGISTQHVTIEPIFAEK